MFRTGDGTACGTMAKAKTLGPRGYREPRGSVRRVLLAVMSAGLVMVLIACGITKAPRAIMLRTRSLAGGRVDIRVMVDPRANQNSPVAVDLIFVYNEALLERLVQLSAKQWFAQREQIRRDFLPGEGAEVWSWEWIPGQKIPVQQLPIKPSAIAGLVFADYRSPGNHRFRIDPSEDMVIQLGSQDLTVDTEDDLKKRIAKAKEDMPVSVSLDKAALTEPVTTAIDEKIDASGAPLKTTTE